MSFCKISSTTVQLDNRCNRSCNEIATAVDRIIQVVFYGGAGGRDRLRERGDFAFCLFFVYFPHGKSAVRSKKQNIDVWRNLSDPD